MAEQRETKETPAETMPATHAAIVNDSLPEYREAWAAEKKGKPLPPVAKPTVLGDEEYKALRARHEAGDFLTDVELKSFRKTSNARRQAEINEESRKAAQRAKEDFEKASDEKFKASEERIAKLERELAEAKVPRQPVPVVEPTRQPVAAASSELKAPDPNDSAKYPAGEYDPRFIRDSAKYEIKQELAASEKAAKEAQQRETAQKQWTDAKLKFHEGLTAAMESDPEVKAAMDGDLGQNRLIPKEEIPEAAWKDLEARAQHGDYRAQGLVMMHEMASAIVRSPIGPQLLKYFHQHPDAVTQVLREGPHTFYRIEGQLQYLASAPTSSASAPKTPAPAPPPPVKRVTDAPAPPPALGTREAAPTDPIAAAISAGQGSLSGGVRDYKAAWLAERSGSRR